MNLVLHLRHALLPFGDHFGNFNNHSGPTVVEEGG